MGVSSSVELQEGFSPITTWPWMKLQTVVKNYGEGEYDFGIDFALVMTLTGMAEADAKTMIRAHAKNDTGIINALTFIVTLICLSDSDRRNEAGRLLLIFDLFDFNRASQISIDELSILLLCVVSSFAFILGRPSDLPSDSAMIDFAHAIYELLDKKKTSPISKDELVSVATDRLFKAGAMSIDTLFDRFLMGPASISKEPEKDTKDKQGGKKR